MPQKRPNTTYESPVLPARSPATTCGAAQGGASVGAVLIRYHRSYPLLMGCVLQCKEVVECELEAKETCFKRPVSPKEPYFTTQRDLLILVLQRKEVVKYELEVAAHHASAQVRCHLACHLKVYSIKVSI